MIDKIELAEPGELEVRPAGQQGARQFTVDRQFALMTTLAAYCAVILVGVSHHEPWADEAQAWLLSRDLGYRYLVFHQLAYEGVPPLWPTILWVANHWFHLPYQSLGWIGVLCAIAGCWFFCRYSPFPLLVRVLMPFTYFIAFQYAIVARPYVLLPLCAFAAAHFFADAAERPWRFVSAASSLALLSATGVMLALGLTVSRAWYCCRSWKEIPPNKRTQLLGAAILFCVVMAFVALVNWPPSDRSFARFDRPLEEGNFGVKIIARDVSTAFFGASIPSIAFLLVVGAWCACRGRFLSFALPIGFLLIFFVKVYGNLWHCGALTIAGIAALWIAWPLQRNDAPRLERVLYPVILFGVVSLSAVQIYWSARTLAMDYSGAYSGSLDAAKFLRSVGADASSTCGGGFHNVAVQAYFPLSIFKNWPQGESFWRLEMGNRVNQSCHDAKWIVLPICCTFDSAQAFYQDDRSVRSSGYVPVHFSHGAMFFEGREVEPTDFVMYHLPAH